MRVVTPALAFPSRKLQNTQNESSEVILMHSLRTFALSLFFNLHSVRTMILFLFEISREEMRLYLLSRHNSSSHPLLVFFCRLFSSYFSIFFSFFLFITSSLYFPFLVVITSKYLFIPLTFTVRISKGVLEGLAPDGAGVSPLFLFIII